MSALSCQSSAQSAPRTAEDRDLGVETACGAAPARLTRDDLGAGAAVQLLLVKGDDDHETWRSHGLVVAQPGANLAWPGPAAPARLPRVATNKGDAPGADDALRAFAAWSRAQATDLVADLGRRKVARALESWAVRTLCGDRWLAAETAPVAAELVCACEESREHKLLRAGIDDLIEELLSDRDLARLRELATAQLAGVDRLSALLASPGRADADDRAALDAAWRSAYQELRDELLASAALSDDVRRALTETSVDVHFSPTYSPDAWRAALTRAAARPRLLAQLWPQAGAEDLAALDYQDARVMEIAEDLARWCARYSEAITRGWDAARARDALLLWLSPTEVPRARREGAVAALLVDRAVSRATRYAALRLRSALDMQAEVDDG